MSETSLLLEKYRSLKAVRDKAAAAEVIDIKTLTSTQKEMSKIYSRIESKTH